MLIIGITGNSGSGKTLACKQLEELGAVVLNADIIYDELMQPESPMMQQLCCAFGEQFILQNGMLDRKKLGEIIFSDTDSREMLNRITHPGIVKEIQARITAMAAKKVQVVAVEAALLFESGMEKFMDEVWVIDAPYQEKVNRIMARDGLSKADASKRLFAQSDPFTLRKYAQLCISNDGSADKLRATISDEFIRITTENNL